MKNKTKGKLYILAGFICFFILMNTIAYFVFNIGCGYFVECMTYLETLKHTLKYTPYIFGVIICLAFIIYLGVKGLSNLEVD